MGAQRPKVMVVDDDPGMRITLEGVIDAEGYEVVSVSRGYEAIEMAEQFSFDLIFIDIKMPGINGVDTYREIKKVSPHSVVVMMTGFSVEELVKEAMAEGAYAVLYKPLEMEQVVDILESVLKTTCVLVVDDLPAHRETLLAILEESGHQVSEARSGEEAVARAAEQHYDVVVMDVRMPGMDGFTASEEIRKIDPQAKVIFVTGHALEDSPREALFAGAYTVLNKPVEPEALLTLVRAITQSDSEATSREVRAWTTRQTY